LKSAFSVHRGMSPIKVAKKGWHIVLSCLRNVTADSQELPKTPIVLPKKRAHTAGGDVPEDEKTKPVSIDSWT